MVSSKTSQRERPLLLAVYMAVSASRTISAADCVSLAARRDADADRTENAAVRPARTVPAVPSRCVAPPERPPPDRKGRTTAPRTRRRPAARASRGMSGRTRESPVRTPRTRRSAMATSNWSPARCPRLSLISLNRSISRNITANGAAGLGAIAGEFLFQTFHEKYAVGQSGKRIEYLAAVTSLIEPAIRTTWPAPSPDRRAAAAHPSIVPSRWRMRCSDSKCLAARRPVRARSTSRNFSRSPGCTRENHSPAPSPISPSR